MSNSKKQNKNSPKPKGKKNIIDNNLVSIANDIADELWDLIRFWSPFSQTIIGNRFIQCLDEISILALRQNEKREKAALTNKQQIGMLLKEALLWLDKSRRRRLLNEEDYQNFYVKIGSIRP